MMDNKRDSSRVGIVIEIRIICDDGTEYTLNSRNISDTGVFLEYDEQKIDLEIGAHVVLQVCSQLGDGEPPPVKAEVARMTNEGIGLQFIL